MITICFILYLLFTLFYCYYLFYLIIAIYNIDKIDSNRVYYQLFLCIFYKLNYINKKVN